MPTRYGLEVIDPELACAPFASDDGRAYYAAMCCAANMAFANRQVILHRIREVFAEVFERPAGTLGLTTVYDVAHNTAKLETHLLHGRPRELLVHRKGATRALPPKHPDLPPAYREWRGRRDSYFRGGLSPGSPCQRFTMPVSNPNRSRIRPTL